MKWSGLVVTGLGVAALLGASDSRALAVQQNPPSRTNRPSRPKDAPTDGSADDQYNYLAGLFEKGFHEMVVTEARKFLASHADHPRAPLARYRLGQSLFELGRFSDARSELARLEPPPEKFEYAVEVSFRVGQCELETKELADAARRFDAIVADHGDHYLAPAAAWFAGETHFKLNEFAAAAKSYAKAVKSENADYARGSLYGLGWALYKAGEFENAASSLDLFVRKYPKDAAAAEAQFLLGECERQLGRPADAIAAFQKVPPGEWLDDALSAAGFAAADMKDDAKAASWFLRLELAVPDSPLLPEARLHAGIHLQRVNRDDDAAGVLDRLLASDAGSFAAEACYWRGLVERRRAGPKAAVPFFTRGLESRPSKELEPRLAVARADALFDAGDFEAAKDAYAKAGGASEDAAYSSAVAALNGGDLDGAIQRSRDFLARYAKGKRAGAANLVLGEALFAQKKWSDALPAFEASAQAGDESRPRSLSRAGWCCFQLKKFADAAARFAALVQEFPKDERTAEASFMAGRSFLRAGDAKSAEPALKLHLDRFAKSEWSDDARYDLAQCERSLGKEDEARRLLAELARGGGNGNGNAAKLARRAALESAEALAAQEKHAEAIATLAPLLDEKSGDVPLDVRRSALYATAWSQFALKNHDDAGNSLAKLDATATRDSPLPKDVAAPALELAVSVARARKDGAAARSAFTRLAEVAPDGERTPESGLVAALALEENGDPKSAADLLAEVTRRWPRWSGADRASWQRALALTKAGDGDGAKAQLARFERDFPQSPLAGQVAFELGERAYAAGDFDGALAQYAKVQDGATVADSALYKSAWCRFQKKEFAAAADVFAQVPQRFEKSPLAGESRFLAGESLYRAGQFERAAGLLAAFLAKHPKHEQRANALFRVGLCHGELGQLDDCFDALTRLTREFPSFELRAEADLWLGRALLERKRTNEAVERFDAVIAADRGVLAARAHLGRGDAFAAQNRGEDALGEYLKVALLFDSEPEVASALWKAGQTLEQKGDRDKAVARYRELLDNHAKTKEADSARDRLRELDPKKTY